MENACKSSGQRFVRTVYQTVAATAQLKAMHWRSQAHTCTCTMVFSHLCQSAHSNVTGTHRDSVSRSGAHTFECLGAKFLETWLDFDSQVQDDQADCNPRILYEAKKKKEERNQTC